MFGRKQKQRLSHEPAPPPPPPAPVNASLRLTLASAGAVALSFCVTAFLALAPFAAAPGVASLGLIAIESAAPKPADGVLAAVLTVWGYCSTTVDGTQTCYPATDLKTIGNNSYNFQFAPEPLSNLSSKQFTVSQTLDTIPYKTIPLLIFALPTVTIFLGIALISSLATLLFFFARNFSHAWVVCAKFTSTVCLISWIVLLVCCVGSGIAASGLVAFLANFQGITASQSPAGLALMVTALIADTAAMVLSTWSCMNAKKYDEFLDEKDQYEMEMAAAPRYNDDRSLGRQGTGKKKRNSWEEPPPSRQRRDDDRGDRRGGGGGGNRGGNNRCGGGGGDRRRKDRTSYYNDNRWSRRNSYQDIESGNNNSYQAKSVGKDAGAGAAPAAEKSDWGILRTVNGVAGGVYGYFAGPAKPEPEPEKPKGNAIKNASSSKKRGGDRSPDRSRRSSPHRPNNSSRSKSRGRNGSPDRRRR
ncbi:hypothetical protein BDR26DRAFT_1003576 [Obelidium mucronatum]|nr:hypothetical protein BDR26DRAFT_1003576 [Obelidium mucronatum]